MNICTKCANPIPSGHEVWMRSRRANKKVALCSACGHAVRQAIRARKPQGVKPENANPSVSDGFSVTTPPSSIDTSPALEPSASSPSAAASSDIIPGISSGQDVIPLSAFLILTAIILVMAPVFGSIIAFVGSYIYLIFLFPFLIGRANGIVLSEGIRWCKLRDPVVAAVFSILLSLAVYGAYRYFDYALFREGVQADIMAEMEAEVGTSDASIASEIFDEVLVEETGQSGFLGAVLFQAQEGMSIGRIGSPMDLNIGTALTWIYWLFELGVIAGITAMAAYETAQKPFCVHHDRWYNELKLGGVEADRADELLELLERGDLKTAGGVLRPKTPVPGVELSMEHCAGCLTSPAILTIAALKRTAQGKTDSATITAVRLTPVESETILAGVQGRRL